MRSSESATARRSRGASTTSIAVVLLVTLLTSAGLALSAADHSMFTATQYLRHTQSLMLAESAVEDAMAQLDSEADWATFRMPITNYTQRHQVGNGMVWADVHNDLFDPGGSLDTNGMVLVKGYGQMLNSSYIENIEVLYYRPTFDLPPVAGVVMCGQDILDGGHGAQTISGYNHYLPPQGCTGSHCNGVRNFVAPDVVGVAFETAGAESRASFPNTVQGSPAIASGVCWLQGRGGLCSRARVLMKNINRMVGLKTLTSWPSNSGTVSDPQFIHVAKNTELRLTGNNQGTGILFVDGTLTCRGTFTWTGAIFVGPGGLLDLNGTYNIFGSVITAGSNAKPATVSISGNASINWAADAINIGPINIPAMMSSWREFK